MAVNLKPVTISEFLTGLPISWLNQNPIGAAYAGGIGYICDINVNRLFQAVQARFPTLAPEDALQYLGNERGLIKSEDETNEEFAQRLVLAWVQWRLAGTPVGLLFQLYYQGYTGAYLIQQNGLIFTLNGIPNLDAPEDSLITEDAGTNPLIEGTPEWWTIDLNNEFTSRFLILFPTPPAAWDDIQSTDPLYGIGPRDGYTTDTSAPSTSDINIISNIVNKWKPAKATCTGLHVVTDGYCIGYPVGSMADRETLTGGGTGTSVVVKFNI